jgi:hypothetical protein
MVYHSGHLNIAATFAIPNAAHAMSIDSGCRESVTRMANRLDRCVVTELLA